MIIQSGINQLINEPLGLVKQDSWLTYEILSGLHKKGQEVPLKRIEGFTYFSVGVLKPVFIQLYDDFRQARIKRRAFNLCFNQSPFDKIFSRIKNQSPGPFAIIVDFPIMVTTESIN